MVLWNDLDPWQQFLSRIYAIASLHIHWPVANVSAAAVLGAFCDGKNGPQYSKDVHFVADEHTSSARRVLTPVRFHYAKNCRPTEKIKELIASGIIHKQTNIVRDPQLLAQSYISINAYVGVCNGILVTSPLQTIFDCLRRLPFEDALKICDSLAKIYGLSNEQICEFIHIRKNCWKNFATRYKMQFVDEKSENGGESFCRGRMIRGGFVAPQLQKIIANPFYRNGKARSARTVRADYYWEILHVGQKSNEPKRIVAELDGRAKYVDEEMLRNTYSRDAIDAIIREKDRETVLSVLGYVIVRFGFSEAYYNNGREMLKKLRTAGVPMVGDKERKRRKRLLARWIGERTLMRL